MDKKGSHDNINTFRTCIHHLVNNDKIKLTTKKEKGNLFTIECYMPSFEPQNETVRKQHASMFKHDKFTFNP